MGRIAKRMGMATALLLVAVPALGQGAPGVDRPDRMGPGMRGGGPEVMARNPVAMVMEHREALELTEAQIRTLEGLRARIEEENGPRWDRLQEALGDGPPRDLSAEDRDALRERMRELAPVREEIRATNRAAMDEVRELLTEEQHDMLRSFMRQGPRGPAGPRPGMRRGGAGPMGSAWSHGFARGFERGFLAGRRAHRPGW